MTYVGTLRNERLSIPFVAGGWAVAIAGTALADFVMLDGRLRGVSLTGIGTICDASTILIVAFFLGIPYWMVEVTMTKVFRARCDVWNTGGRIG